MASAGEVPTKYDLVLNGQGYCFLDTEPIRARYAISPTFVGRQNTTGSYGDEQQDFWLTYAQKDWSGGEQHRYQARGDNPRNGFWKGVAVDLAVPGQAGVKNAARLVTLSAAVRGACPRTIDHAGRSAVVTCSSTNVFEATMDTDDSSFTDLGVHGLGAQPGQFGLASDGAHVFLSTTAAGTVGVRKMAGLTNAPAFSTFSATSSDALAFLNNTLYGLVYSTGIFQRYDSAGAASTIFQWKDSAGAAKTLTPNGELPVMVPFGGNLLILLPQGSSNCSELWLFDGAGVKRMWQMPNDFYAYDLCVSHGTVFVSGGFLRVKAASTVTYARKNAVLFWAQGNEGQLWRGDAWEDDGLGTPADMYYPGITAWDNGVVWNYTPSSLSHAVALNLFYYDLSTGGLSNVTYWGAAANAQTQMAAASGYVAVCGVPVGFGPTVNKGVLTWPDGASYYTVGSLYSSLIDFDSALDKVFRGIKVDWELANGGSGGTVDITYKVNSVDEFGVATTYTSLQTGAASGTEYTLSNVTGRSISVGLILNSDSAGGPWIKRVSVRAAPKLTQFKAREYILDLTLGRKLRDGSTIQKNGREQANDLFTAAAANPFTVTDRFGSYTGTIETIELDEIRAAVTDPAKSGEFFARVRVREV